MNSTSLFDISVVMITYGHEMLIEQAINSILEQQLDLKVELIISNDCSPDDTNKVVHRLIENNPSNIEIRYFNHEVNKGIYPNFAFALDEARGEFIAICEGDDYWDDKQKLQRQYEVIKANPNISMVFNSSNILSMGDNQIYPEIPAENRNYSIDELLLTKVAHTASFMLRRSLLDTSLILHPDVFGADLVIALSMAHQGEVYGMKEYMSTYRKHEGGITNSSEKSLGVEHYKRFVRQFIYIKSIFPSLSKHAASIKIVDNCMTVITKQGWQHPLSNMKYLMIACYHHPQIIVKGIKKIVRFGK